jgi:hypothetical protein
MKDEGHAIRLALCKGMSQAFSSFTSLRSPLTR